MDDQRGVRRDQRTNGAVLALEQSGAIERAGQGVIEGAVAVAVDSGGIGAAPQQELHDGGIAVAGGHHQRRHISLLRPRLGFEVERPVDVRA